MWLTTIPAIIGAVMPQEQLVAMIRWAEPEFTSGLLVSYLVRCLMAIYGVMGVQALIWSNDVRRYRPSILSLCVSCIIVAVVGLGVILARDTPPERTRAFWVIFIDLAEGLAVLIALLALTLRIPRYSQKA